MTDIAINPCTRCGKERVDIKKWTEKVTTAIGVTELKHTESVCPDAECQAIVDQQIQVRMEKKEARDQQIEERKQRAISARGNRHKQN